MKETERLASQLDRALRGNAWYGPSWREVLEGVTRAAALERPLPAAHSIAEIVLHTTTWLEVVRCRLGGESPEVSSTEDWPPAPLLTESEWPQALDRLFDAGRTLGEAIRRFPLERLHTQRPGMDETWFELIAGELQHLLYHEGQIALLRKSVPAQGR
jgi:hypothetical protein